MSGFAFLSHMVFGLALFLGSALLTRLMIRVNIADEPNARSSHDRPTPKSGGVAVAATFLAGVVILYAVGDTARLPEGAFVAFLLLAGAMAVFALIDDIKTLPVRAKLPVQFGLAILFALFVARIDWGIGGWGYAVTAIWIAGFVNAFNFMDGIDGLAGGCAAIAAAFLAAAGFLAGAPFVYLGAICLLGPVLGFLVFNLPRARFPRARIFLGDTGSQFIGFVFAALAVIGAEAANGAVPLAAVPMLFYPFLYDVCMTLAYRAARRRDILAAHRDHHYQLLIGLGWRSGRVAALYFALFVLHGGAAMLIAGMDGGLGVLLYPLPLYLAGSVILYRTVMRGENAPQD